MIKANGTLQELRTQLLSTGLTMAQLGRVTDSLNEHRRILHTAIGTPTLEQMAEADKDASSRMYENGHVSEL